MNKRQEQFIEKLKQHLINNVSLGEMKSWLEANVYDVLVQSNVHTKPGMWLEFYACREIYWHIRDIEEETRIELNWYWLEVQRVLTLLLGQVPYNRTVYNSEYPLTHKERKADLWMMPHLQYVETVIQKLKNDIRTSSLELPELEIAFEPARVTEQTYSEIVMSNMLNLIESQEEIAGAFSYPNSSGPDIKTILLPRLEKLTHCFKGELGYTVSTTFEGVDRFSISMHII